MDTDPDVSTYAVVAHGLLTSASVVVGLVETLDQRWELLDDRTRRELVATVGDQARTIQGVLQSLVTSLPEAVFEPLREAIASQIQPQAVDRDTAVRSDAATDASPNTSSDGRS